MLALNGKKWCHVWRCATEWDDILPGLNVRQSDNLTNWMRRYSARTECQTVWQSHQLNHWNWTLSRGGRCFQLRFDLMILELLFTLLGRTCAWKTKFSGNCSSFKQIYGMIDLLYSWCLLSKDSICCSKVGEHSQGLDSLMEEFVSFLATV